jgi:sterol desaturase/sphingolipid hydroxylase (fatty acid hydroxylase superfamily)
MDSFLSYIETMPLWGRFVWIVAVVSLFWILEGYYSFVKTPYNRWKHAGTNFVFLLFTILINILFGIATASVFIWLDQSQFGFLNFIELPTWLGLLLAVMWLDLIAQYVAHYLLHKVKWLWKLHLVHHSDTQVDVSTGTRHHPLDYTVRETFALIAIVLSGMPVAYYLIYRLLSVFFTYFNHANISLGKIDKILAYVIVTPDMHKFHHHYQMPWTDTNFGNIFSFWDRLFGTWIYQDPNQVVYGLDIVDPDKDQNLGYQLSLPFRKEIDSNKPVYPSKDSTS